MNTMIRRTAIAAAISSAIGFAPAASAYDHQFTATHGTVVLANVIFGEGNPGVGSEETLITAPSVISNLQIATGTNLGDSIASGSTATIKYTLGGAAIFGEDLSTTALIDAANGGNGVFSGNSTGWGAFDATSNGGIGGINYEVIAGGAIGDNTITIEITNDQGGPDALVNLTFESYKVKNLTSALKPSVSGKVELGTEYVEADPGDADDVVTTATDTPIAIFGSQSPVSMTATAYNVNTEKHMINVADSELNFTNTSSGANDFTTGGPDTQALGTVQLNLTTASCTAFPLEAGCVASGGVVGNPVSKEAGIDFDFQGGDTFAMDLTGNFDAFTTIGGGSIFMTDTLVSVLGVTTAGAGSCPANASGLGGTIATVIPGMADFTLVGDTTQLTTAYDVCVTADGTTKIPTESTIAGTYTIDYFNSRYDNSSLTVGDIGPILRNGCIASIFNVPASNNTNDSAFIRLSNTSSSITGDVRATVYAQDGTVLASNEDLSLALAPHATQVYTSGPADITTGAGETIISIQNALGIADDDYKGRARVVLTGSFPTCEALGLIRNQSTNILTNMTATTQGNETRNGDNAGNNGN